MTTLREQRQEAFGGRLVGKADVMFRGSNPRIEDYKTGSLYEDDNGTVLKPEYRFQMLLYAVLEHEATGVWPTTATLVPLEGSPVEISIDPDEAGRAAARALADLDAYNSRVGTVESVADLASPSPDTCRFCVYAIDCPAVWNVADSSWADSPKMLSGSVLGVEIARSGLFSLSIAAVRGTVPSDTYLLYQLDPQRFEPLLETESGAEVAFTWLTGNAESRQLRATSMTRFAVAAETAVPQVLIDSGAPG